VSAGKEGKAKSGKMPLTKVFGGEYGRGVQKSERDNTTGYSGDEQDGQEAEKVWGG